MSIPGMDSVLDSNGRNAGSMDRRDVTFGFRVWTEDLDAAYDLLAAKLGPGTPVRLVYQTDSGTLRYTIGSHAKITHTVVAANKGGTSYADFTVVFRIRPWWTLRYSEAEPTRFLGDNSERFSSANDEVFLVPGATQIATDPQPFVMDATGVAGADRPTLPDTAPVFTLIGPCGGSGGITVANTTWLVTDPTGAQQSGFFTIPFPLQTVNDSVSLDFGSQTFLHNGVPFRPQRPAYQPYWFAVMPGVVNTCTTIGVGAGVIRGGYVTRSWYRRFA